MNTILANRPARLAKTPANLRKTLDRKIEMATPAGIEPATFSLEGILMREGCCRDFSGLRFAATIVVGVFVGPFRGLASGGCFPGEFLRDLRSYGSTVSTPPRMRCQATSRLGKERHELCVITPAR